MLSPCQLALQKRISFCSLYSKKMNTLSGPLGSLFFCFGKRNGVRKELKLSVKRKYFGIYVSFFSVQFIKGKYATSRFLSYGVCECFLQWPLDGGLSSILPSGLQ